MKENEMQDLFERFKKEVLADLPDEAARERAVNAFIFGFSKL